MNITEAASWTTPVPLIDDGDSLSNAEFLATAQALANRTAKIATLVAGLPGNKTLPIALNPVWNQSSAFALNLSSKHFWLEQNVATGVGGLYFWLPPLPVGVRLVSCTMRWTGARTGAHGTLPTTMPAIEASYQDDISDTQIASQSDTSATVGAYDVPHDVIVTLNHDIVAAPRQYFVLVTGENGGTLGTALPSLYGVYMTVGAIP
jgi:hypothetical protein